MNTKTLAAGTLFLLATLAPAALGHDERGSFGADPNGVSGRYLGASNAQVIGGCSSLAASFGGPARLPSTRLTSRPEHDRPLDPEPQEGPLDPLLDSIEALITGTQPPPSSGCTNRSQMLCDLEVAGDGTVPFPQDEENVDGSSGGSVSDRWDDGGFGGACHSNGYLYTSYNTPGCPLARSLAVDASRLDVFIGASCDWKTVVAGTPQTDILLTCTVGSLLSGQPLNIVQCLLTYLSCALSPTGDCTTDGTESCGSDGVSDGTNYGHGSTGVAYPTASAHQGDVALGLNPSANCFTGDATAMTYVYNAVDSHGGNPQVHTATTGEIWQSSSSTLPPCRNASASEPMVSQPACTRAPVGTCSPWVSVWNPVTMSPVNSC